MTIFNPYPILSWVVKYRIFYFFLFSNLMINF